MRRKLWRKERLNDEWIDVYLVENLADEEGTPLHGMWDDSESYIAVEWRDTDKSKYATLLHERIHAISDRFGLDLDETTVRVLERGLMQMERDYVPGEDFNA